MLLYLCIDISWYVSYRTASITIRFVSVDSHIVPALDRCITYCIQLIGLDSFMKKHSDIFSLSHLLLSWPFWLIVTFCPWAGPNLKRAEGSKGTKTVGPNQRKQLRQFNIEAPKLIYKRQIIWHSWIISCWWKPYKRIIQPVRRR